MVKRLSAFPLSADRLGALRAELESFSPGIARRGEAYADDGRVHALEAQPDKIEASVRGGSDYHVLWWWNGRRWSHECTCPYGAGCKHAYAVASEVVDGTDGDGAAPSDALTRLRDHRALWERQAALDELLVDAPTASLTPYGPPLEDLLREPDADTRCWRLAAAIAAESGGWVPPALVQYLERGDVANRFRDRERAATAAALLDWARQRGAHPPRRLRIVFSLQYAADGTPAVSFEVRLTTPRVHDAPRTVGQLHGLRTECLRDPGLFQAEQATLLAWLADQAQPNAAEWNGTQLQVPRPVALLDRAAVAGVGEWADAIDATLAARAGVMPGAAVRVGRADVRVVPANISVSDDLSLDLRVRWDDGEERSLSEVLYVPSEAGAGRGSMVLRGGEAFAVADEPPAALRARFEREGPLPVPRQERAPLMRALAEAFPHLHETLSAHTRVHAVAPSVALDLRDDWLQMRVFARSGRVPWNPSAPLGDDAVLFELSPERGWARAERGARPTPAFADLAAGADAAPAEAAEPSAPAAASGEAWIELPDPVAVAPLTAWVRALPLASAARIGAPEGVASGWWMRVARRSLEALAEAWERRPAGVAFFGTAAHAPPARRARVRCPAPARRASGVDWLAVSAEWEAEGLRLDEADLAALRARQRTRFVKLDSRAGCAATSSRSTTTPPSCSPISASSSATASSGVSVWQLAGASRGRPGAPRDARRRRRDAGGASTRCASAIARFDRHRRRCRCRPALTATLRPYQRHGLDFLAYTSRARPRRRARRRHGPRQDGAGARLAAAPARARTRRRPGAGRLPGLGGAQLGARGGALHAGAARPAAHQRQGAPRAARGDSARTTWWSPTTRCCAATSRPGSGVTLRAAILDEAQIIKNPDAAVTRAALRAATPAIAWRSPARRSRTAPSTCGASCSSSTRATSAARAAFVRALRSRRRAAARARAARRQAAPGAAAPHQAGGRARAAAAHRGAARLRADHASSASSTSPSCASSRALLAQIAGTPERLRARARSRSSPRSPACARSAATRRWPAAAPISARASSTRCSSCSSRCSPRATRCWSSRSSCSASSCSARRCKDARHPLPHAHRRDDQARARWWRRSRTIPSRRVFLISLKAGGTGLNLTAATYVVLFDPWWNPAVEAQAIDRTHRIGQDRTVIAYRLLARGTIEEKIWELQQRKAALVRDVLGEGGFARALTRDDLEYLLADVTAAV